MSSILIRNPLLIATMNDNHQEFRGGHIYIEGNRIVSVGPEPLDRPADKVIDATNMVVLPGFINTHHHLFQSLTRNVPLMANAPLFEWLTNHYEIWREIRTEGIRVSAKTALLEMMKSGVTTSSDHLYLYPSEADPELMDAEIDSAHELGIRFQPTRGSMSLGKSHGGLPPDDIIQTEDEIRKDVIRVLEKYHDPDFGAMVRISLAPCSPFNVTPSEMKSTVEFAKANQLRIHTHLAETLDEEEFCLSEFGKRPVDYMADLGWINGDAWFAHAIHLNDDEVRRFAEVGVGISHCPSSNMRLGSGIARVKELMQEGAAVSLGVDGTASNDSGNMLMEIRKAMMISRLRDRDYWLTAREALWLATRGGARVLGRDDIGELAPGKCADLVMFDVNRLEYAGGMSDPLAALVFSVRMSPVDHVIVDGKEVISKTKSVVDEMDLVRQHNQISEDILKIATEKTGIDFLKQPE